MNRDKRQPSKFSQFLDRKGTIPRGAIDPGANRGPSQVDLHKRIASLVQLDHCLIYRISEASELLAESYRNCILHLCTPHLEHIFKLHSLGFEGSLELIHAL